MINVITITIDQLTDIIGILLRYDLFKLYFLIPIVIILVTVIKKVVG